MVRALSKRPAWSRIHWSWSDREVVMSENAFMRRAAALALEKMRANSGGPFGAVIVRNDTIFAEGWNEVTSSNDPTAHAEIVAIRRACTLLGGFNLPDCDIYTSFEPCPMCLGAIYWARLRRVYYANTRADASRVAAPVHHEYAFEPRKHGKRAIRSWIASLRSQRRVY